MSQPRKGDYESLYGPIWCDNCGSRVKWDSSKASMKKKGQENFYCNRHCHLTSDRYQKHLKDKAESSKGKASGKAFNVNYNYFKEIDTRDKAYWLGYIAADGCVTERKGSKGALCFEVVSIDRELLDNLKEDISLDGEVEVVSSPCKQQDTQIYRLRVGDRRFSENLTKWGIVPRKTKVYEFPRFLDNALMADYIRGYMDGDGTIYTSSHYDKRREKRYDTFVWRIVGTEDLIKGVSEYLFNEGVSKYTSCTSVGVPGVYGCTKSASEALKVCNYIYKDNPHRFLKRKRDRFEKQLNDNPEKGFVKIFKESVEDVSI